MSEENRGILTDEIKRSLAYLMQAHGIKNPTQLAGLTGIPQPTLSRMLNGTHKSIELETVRKLARYFKVSIDAIIGDEPLKVGHASKSEEGGSQLNSL